MKQRITLLLFTLFVATRLVGQSPLSHPPKLYKSAEGKIFINKSLPVYLRIATSPDEKAESMLLTSEESKKYTNPMYFDTEGLNTVRSPSKVDTVTKEIVYPMEDIIFEVYTDSRPPSCELNMQNSKAVTREGVIYLNKPYSVSFTTSDAMSGVEGVYLSVNGENYARFEGTLQLDKPQKYSLKFYAVDNVGNRMEPIEKILYIDREAPKTSLSISHDEYQQILSTRSQLLLESTDQGAGVKNTYYQLDENRPRPFAGQPIPLKNLAEGEHTLHYYAQDYCGNREDTTSYSFYLDKTAPIVVEELLGATFVANGKEYASGRSRVKLTAMDNKAGVKEIRYSINGGEFITYTTPFSIKASGNLTIETFVQDKVNNQQVKTLFAHQKNVSYVDLTGPELSFDFRGPHFQNHDTTFITTTTQIRLHASDDESGMAKIEYQVNREPVRPYEAPFQLTEAGTHKVTFTGYDNVQNTYTQEFTVVTDTVGPEIFHRFSIASEKQKRIDGELLPVYPPHVVLFLSATDKLVGLDALTYTLNKGKEQSYKSLIQNFSQGKHSLQVKATDKLGNQAQSSFSFLVE